MIVLAVPRQSEQGWIRSIDFSIIPGQGSLSVNLQKRVHLFQASSRIPTICSKEIFFLACWLNSLLRSRGVISYRGSCWKFALPRNSLGVLSFSCMWVSQASPARTGKKFRQTSAECWNSMQSLAKQALHFPSPFSDSMLWTKRTGTTRIAVPKGFFHLIHWDL